MLKVNKFFVDFEHVSHLALAFVIVNFNQINTG